MADRVFAILNNQHDNMRQKSAEAIFTEARKRGAFFYLQFVAACASRYIPKQRKNSEDNA
jgi:hypothetical protein